MTTKITSAAAILGKLGGSVKSEAKTASSRENGKRGGRPRMAYQIVDGFNGHRSSGHRTLKAAGAALTSAKTRFYQRNPNADCWLQTADQKGISISQVVRDLIDEARKQAERESMTA